jgi:hypothetical protein
VDNDSGACNNNYFENMIVENPKSKVCVVIKESHFNHLKGLYLINNTSKKVSLLGGDGERGNILEDASVFGE